MDRHVIGVDRVGQSEDLREQILEAYAEMGLPPEHAEALVNAAFDTHNSIEDRRSRIVERVGQPFFDGHGFDRNYLMLVVQLEILHLQTVYHSMQTDQPPETVQ
jgi:hypothetical protein